ncbi:unnamed protein product [Zymoseptoria tritici ST99CH_1E4]|uniref:Zn(2)-C6 fungal-type domain-containing protein n=1 Tax=Zymoseptoria tritici ST99CH_1E4 TaxID=1276532 RepID=A0A2H1GK74_ZYMTR|nr:unnamed protein product [Zymoseptoria tritici ST99CH_1E4]
MMDSRRPSTYGQPPPPPHDPRQQQPPQQQQHHPQHHYQHPHPPPPPPQYSSPHPPPAPPPSQQQAPPPHHHQTHPPPPHSAPSHPGPPPPRALPPQQQQQQQQYQSRPPPPQSQQYPSSVGGGPPSQSPALPPIQSAAFPPPATTSSEQQVLPSFRHPSAPPSHDPGPEYRHQHPQYNHVSSGHQTPASVNRTYSHDSGHQRSPTTPSNGPPPSHYPPGSDGQQPGPPPQQMEHGGHHGYPPNGVPVPHGMPQHHPEQHHPQYMPPMMDQHHGYGPPGPPMYGAPNYGPASSNAYGPKRKQMRATQACEQCRQRKQKCDEGNPCSFCKENSLPCQYRDTPPVKTDKNMEKLLAHMEAHTAGLEALTSKIDSVDARLRRVEQYGPQNGPQAGQVARGIQSSQPVQQRFEPVDDGSSEDEAKKSKRKRKAGSDDHRTAPHKLLLLWPSIKPLLKRAGVKHNDGYVMEAEDRGILRLWTRGEGIDEHDGTAPGVPASPARSDDSSEAGNATTPQPEGIWGAGFPSTPSSDSSRSEVTGAGGLKSNGDIDLDAATINALYESYMSNIHIMHPFIDKRRLRKMLDHFINRYSRPGKVRAAAFAVGPNSGLDSDGRGVKRQKSNDGSSVNADAQVRKEPTERSPGNAIIYLVLALGKICAWKQPLPSIVADSKLRANAHVSYGIAESRGFAGSSPLSANMRPSPMSPNFTPKPQPTPPTESRSRRSSVEGASSFHTGRRNLDVIPGIAYYAKAAEILGEQGDGNDLVHAQMFLLAGLYKGQLARVKESMSWFSMAGRALCALLDRYKLWNSQYWSEYDVSTDIRQAQLQDQSRVNKDTRSSLIVIASWSCLQLETDILAEMNLPRSQIKDLEDQLLMPGGRVEDEYGELEHAGSREAQKEAQRKIETYFTAQIWLRKRLNKVHLEMYGPECLDQPLDMVQEMFRYHQTFLEAWRKNLPDEYQWHDDDQPPSDILDARLRAKYWGARYVSSRPFLDYALHIMPGLELGKKLEDIATDADGNRRHKADVHLFRAINGMGHDHIWAAARRCVEAAIHSTVAFDNVPPRLIVTNIHGTAHAQFGNMLVLSATYESQYLTQLVPREKFQYLMARTIKFLRGLAPISETCKLDCGILEKFNKTIFGIEDHDMQEVYRNEGVESEEVHKTESVGSGNNSFSMQS